MKKLLLLFAACAIAAALAATSAHAATEKCIILLGGNVCLNPNSISGPGGTFYFNNNASSLGDGNNYTTSISFSGAVLSLARLGMTTLTATLPNQAITIDAANVTTGQLSDARIANSSTWNAKAQAGLCTGGNSTHANVSNGTTSTSISCIMVARDGGSGSGGTVTFVNASTQSSAVINVTPAAGVTTTGTFNFQFPDATTAQSGFATATQITSLNAKALAGNCAGGFVQNATTAGPECGVLPTGDNASWNQSYADTLYYAITNPSNFYNNTTIPAYALLTYVQSLGNYSAVSTELYTNITGLQAQNTTNYATFCSSNGTNCPAGGAGNVTSTNGTANYVARFTSATNIVTGTIQDNGSSVGIGTAPNGNRVTVNGSGNFTDNIYVNNSAVVTRKPLYAVYNATNSRDAPSGTGEKIYADSNFNYQFPAGYFQKGQAAYINVLFNVTSSATAASLTFSTYLYNSSGLATGNTTILQSTTGSPGNSRTSDWLGVSFYVVALDNVGYGARLMVVPMSQGGDTAPVGRVWNLAGIATVNTNSTLTLAFGNNYAATTAGNAITLNGLVIE